MNNLASIIINIMESQSDVVKKLVLKDYEIGDTLGTGK